MATIPKFYKKNIAEGNGILIFAIIFAILIRCLYFLNFETVEVGSANGYLWEFLSPLFGNRFTSSVCSGILTIGLAIIAAYINTKHVLIRQKTVLLPAIIILLFSCNPIFLYMSAEYISTLICLLITSILFTFYNSGFKQTAAFKTSFILTLSSFFTINSLIFFPLLWILLVMMRCMSFKAFLASLLGIFILYIPVFSYYLLINDLDKFLNPFTAISLQQLSYIPIMYMDIMHWAILGFSLFLIGIIFTDNYINRHKDKIKIRAYLRLLSVVLVFAILAYLSLNINPVFNIFIALSTGSFLLSHFFALAERKITIILFYFSVVAYIVICFLPFLYL